MGAPVLSRDAQATRAYLTSKPQYYALVNLALASLAYTDEFAPTAYLPPHDVLVTGDLQNAVGALPALPMPPGSSNSTLAGSWSVVWGPAYPTDYSNLMYVATYNDAASTPANAPVFAVLAIRGTDTNLGDDPLGLLNQLTQDMDAGTLVDWTKACTESSCPASDPLVVRPKIASGTCKGLHKLLGLKPASSVPGAGTTITSFLTQLLASNPGLPVVVTGHSLGACQASVMSPYLQQALSMPATQVVPTLFAPPTAGNGQFASTVLDALPLMNAWANALDLVPMAYSNLAGMNNLWQAYTFADSTEQGPQRPSELNPLYDTLLAIGKLGYHYTQPTTGFVSLSPSPLALPSQAAMTAFLGALSSSQPWNSWLAQLMWQHFPPAYAQLISATYNATTVAPYPLPKAPQNTNPRLGTSA
jgi:Lipase (class 3)